MSLTAHNQFFGWIHSFKISRHNSWFKPNVSTERPFPVIVDDPTIAQVLNNWNYSDTGLVASAFIAGLILSKTLAEKTNFESLLRQRFHYKRLVNIFLFAGVYFGLSNSANRLMGYVPNGLPKKRTQEVLKYDYTSQFLSQTPWKYIYSGRSRPSNQ